MPAALAYLYTSATEVNDLLSSLGVEKRIDHDADEAVSVSETAILTKSLSYGTGRCNLYLSSRYSAASLAEDWNVQDWATVFAACRLCAVRGNPVPKSLLAMRDEALEQMEMVQEGLLQLDAIQNVTDLPAFSNGRLDDRYRVRKWRIQRPLSDNTPGGPRQANSMEADILGPLELYP